MFLGDIKRILVYIFFTIKKTQGIKYGYRDKRNLNK